MHERVREAVAWLYRLRQNPNIKEVWVPNNLFDKSMENSLTEPAIFFTEVTEDGYEAEIFLSVLEASEKYRESA